MKKFDLNRIIEAANNTELPTISTGKSGSRGGYSVSIVNNRNGKRIKISSALVKDLGITEEVFFMPIKEEDVIVISAKKISPKMSRCVVPKTEPTEDNTSAGGTLTFYHAYTIKLITKVFGLDYSECTSKTFREIEIDEYDAGTKIALVTVPSELKAATPSEDSVTTDEDSDEKTA